MSHLALTRKRYQKLFMKIPPSTEERIIEICVAKISHSVSATLAIRAEKDIEIMRDEVCKWKPSMNNTELS